MRAGVETIPRHPEKWRADHFGDRLRSLHEVEFAFSAMNRCPILALMFGLGWQVFVPSCSHKQCGLKFFFHTENPNGQIDDTLNSRDGDSQNRQGRCVDILR